MPGAGRLGDKAQVQGPGDAHGCPGCPHPAIGPAIIGSTTVMVNGRPALRINDTGIHAACCGPNMWTARVGAPTVNINGLAAFRMNDMGQSCGGMNKLIEGSADVIIGDAASGGGGGGGATASGQGSSPEAQAASGSSSSGSPSSTSGTGRDGQTQPDTTAKTPPGQKTDPQPAEEKAWIEVEIVDESGKPRKDMPYKLELPDFSTIEGNLDASGTVRRDQLERGVARLWVPDLDLDHDPVPPVRPENDEKLTSFVDVEILDEQGRPAAGHPVKIELPDGTMVDDKLDEHGRLYRDGLPPGRAQLHLVDVDVARIARPAPAPAEEPEAKAFLDVVITDAGGRPRPNLEVEVELPDGTVATEKTDADGRLRKDGIKAGSVKVHVPDEDEGVASLAAAKAEAKKVVDKADFELEILDAAGRPRAGLAVTIELPDGTVVEEKTDAEGRVRRQGIEPGTVKVHVPDED